MLALLLSANRPLTTSTPRAYHLNVEVGCVHDIDISRNPATWEMHSWYDRWVNQWPNRRNDTVVRARGPASGTAAIEKCQTGTVQMSVNPCISK